MSGMDDESMSAEEFDARMAAGTPVELNVQLVRPWRRAQYSVTFSTETGVSAARDAGSPVRPLESGVGNLQPA